MTSGGSTAAIMSRIMIRTRTSSNCMVRRTCYPMASLTRLASSTTSSSLSDYVTNSVKDAVKTSVLDEITKVDSDLWVEGKRINHHDEQMGEKGGGEEEDSIKLRVNGNDDHHVNGINGSSVSNKKEKNTMHGHQPPSTTSISSPISILNNDPLDDFHLDQLSSSSAVTFTLPPSVAPMTDQTDPFLLSKHDLQNLSESMRNDLIAASNNHPVLERAASYFFDVNNDGGKKVRPMMVLLLSRAMSYGHHYPPHHHTKEEEEEMPLPLAWQRSDLPAAQYRLAEISELIHTASLFHDDVIDKSDTRRGRPSVHKVFGNKMAILAGDYLLARASVFLARLRDVEVVEVMSTIIEHLVRGEVMQMKPVVSSSSFDKRFVYYLRKNFYKTASLMANSCQSAAILGSYEPNIIHAAYRYGKHMGLAFQLVDDLLDYVGDEVEMGKPRFSDLRDGLATAPVLFALQEKEDGDRIQTRIRREELQMMMERKFRQEGDVERAVKLVEESDGISKTKDLAVIHAQLAVEAVMEIGESRYRDALVHLAYKIVNRCH